MSKFQMRLQKKSRLKKHNFRNNFAKIARKFYDLRAIFLSRILSIIKFRKVQKNATKKQTYQFGELTELMAAQFLEKKKYKIIAKRYKTKLGEIDIIAQTSQTLVFVEVKARKNQELLETILRQHQINRIRMAAQIFVAQNLQFQNYDIRFDFILFEKDLEPQHFEAFFE